MVKCDEWFVWCIVVWCVVNTFCGDQVDQICD
jgi:hypothetical protein